MNKNIFKPFEWLEELRWNSQERCDLLLSHRKKGLQRLSEKLIFGKTTGGVKLTSQVSF